MSRGRPGGRLRPNVRFLLGRDGGSARGTGLPLMGLAAVEAAAVAAVAQVMSARTGVVVEHPMAPGAAERIEELRARTPGRSSMRSWRQAGG